MPSAPAPEHELMLLLAGTAERRAAASDRIDELAARVDPTSFAITLGRMSLFALAGSRLAARDGLDDRWDEFRSSVEAAIKLGRQRALLQAGVTHRLLRALEAGGVPAVSLKGPLLGERIYGDAGVRPSADIDLWVAPESFGRTFEVLTDEGYARPAGPGWIRDLPLFECTLWPRKAWLPPIDLHWRVHWYEDSYTARALGAATLDPERRHRHLTRVDEIAALMLTFARDGFDGLKLAADVAAWWDRYGGDLPDLALEPVIADHPALAEPLRTAVEVLERLVGVPAGALVRARVPGRRSRYAGRLANWIGAGSDAERVAIVSLVDWLLRPAGGTASFLRRHLLLPSAVIAEIYGLPPEARLRRGFRRGWYAAIIFAGFLRGYALAAWMVRGRGAWVPLPGPSAGTR